MTKKKQNINDPCEILHATHSIDYDLLNGDIVYVVANLNREIDKYIKNVDRYTRHRFNIELDGGYYESDHINFTLSVYRFESDEEVANRIQIEKDRKEVAKNRTKEAKEARRKDYEKLKKEFESTTVKKKK